MSNLKKLRIEKHISLVGVSNDIKIHRDTLSRIEKGCSDLPARCVKQLAFLYGTSPEVILELHAKDMEQYNKQSLIEQIGEAQKFLNKKDRNSVNKGGVRFEGNN